LSLAVVLSDPLGERPVAPQEFPLSLGGEGARIAVPGLEVDATAGFINCDEHGLYVEADPQSAGALRLNGRILVGQQTLQRGDVLAVGEARIHCDIEPDRARLRVLHLSGNATAVPLIDALAEGEAQEDQSTPQSISALRFKRYAGGPTRAQTPMHWRWAAAAGIAAVALIIWFLVTAVSVQVRTDPTETEVDFAGAWPEISTGEHHLVRPGAYTLVATNDGYRTERRSVRIDSRNDQKLEVKLAKLPGKVTFDTGGVAATATVDGVELGKLPGKFEVAAGVHELIARSPRYLDLKTKIDIEGMGTEQEIKLALKPAFAPVTVESKPAGARVAVDGREVGVTPLTTELDAGNYTLSLAAEGFRTWESAIQVVADVPQKIGPVQLGLPDGRLTLRSTPSQADVSIGGRYRGRTPLEIDLAPGVEHEILLQRAGYEPARRRVPIKSAERLGLEVTLKPILGEVIVRGEPADAVLYIGGEARGPANQTLRLLAVATAVEVRRAGYETFATTVTPQAGLQHLVEYRLQTPDEQRATRVPATAKSRAGTDLKLMPTGRYQMGSPRREPGRRANESQRTVTLQRPFYMGVREVTNGEFRQFRAEHLSGVVGELSLDLDRQPVVNVTWRDAAEFCNWLSEKEGLPPAYVLDGDALVAANAMTTGYRLPTEAEWEWVARYEGGAATRRFPWGASLPVAPKSGNYADIEAVELIGAALEEYEDGALVTSPVGSFAASALGLYDLGGNVAEWTHDLYTSSIDLDKGSDVDPQGPKSGSAHVVRGSSWRTANIAELRLAYRDSSSGKSQHLGFRIARYAE
jgi:formylglycine-generating enzyme required for sulfatase activity